MKKKVILLFVFVSLNIFSQNFITQFEKSKGKETATYEQTIEFYQKLSEIHPEISVQEMGMSDSGFPLHLVIFNTDKIFDFQKITQNTILINNGIHPGEPDGIDASMMLLRDIVQSKELKNQYENIVICIIPIYNVGGSLNRNSTSRTNQNGPVEYGFRGNARNYDLNRDFIKSDTKNTVAFAKIFHSINPDVFIDNHVSNGADYQYTLTHLFTQHNKLGGELGKFMNEKMMPEIVKNLESRDWIITPYVNVFNQVPENGFSQFFDSPRYSTGYTTLFNTLGLMVETHMLKPYKQRVEGTYELMISTLDFLKNHGKEIKKLREKVTENILTKKTYPILWEIDSTKTSILDFKGYEGSYIESEITGQKRLKYDRSKPFTKPITYYNSFKPSKEIIIPKGYLIPKGWWNIINLLNMNNIRIEPILRDTTIHVESYQIKDYKSVKNPYEGHLMHFETEVVKSYQSKVFKKGDYYVPTDQSGIRYLLETLEPEAKDSFFNWNIFDIILQQKEGFSPYVFEDLALEILNQNAKLKSEFELKKKEDPEFRKNWYAQLNFIYKRSNYYEKSHLQYPIYRVLK